MSKAPQAITGEATQNGVPTAAKFLLFWVRRGAVALKEVSGSSGRSDTFLWVACGCLILIKLALVSDLAITMVFGPHDDLLYTSRAYHLLEDGTYGPYDSRLLDKMPGVSLLLAAVRRLGIPYLIFLNLLYASAGLYIVEALRRRRLDRRLLLAMFALFLFNPLTLDHQWFRILRDGADTALLPLFFTAMIFIFQGVERRQTAFFSCLLLSVVFALSVLMREEGILTYVSLLVFDAILVWKARSSGWIKTLSGRWGLAFLLILPLALGAYGNSRARAFALSRYGRPILHEMSEGEYPKLIASMRSVCAQTNRLVQITQEGLGKMRQAVPVLAPLIDRLPPPGTGPTHYSYGRFGISDEWTSGWLNFWIKDCAFQAGLTPDLVKAQNYFREARTAIDAACRDGRLTCQDDGSGLIPPFHLKWTGAFFEELKGALIMTFRPDIGLVAPPPPTYGISVDYGRMYQYVTMTHNFDSLLQARGESPGWKDVPEKYYLSLHYWLRYPDVAMSKEFGPQSQGPEWGAYVHFTKHGQGEGRIWGQRDDDLGSKPMYQNSLAPWRQSVLMVVARLNGLLWLVGAGCAIFRGWTRKLERTPLFWVCMVFLMFLAARSLALAYVSIYMGWVDVRLFFPSYTVGLMLSAALGIETLHLFRAARTPRTNFGAPPTTNLPLD
ncbi:MAG: hypothetical protein V7609_1918 [Verrucomicrobiota bacterium]